MKKRGVGTIVPIMNALLHNDRSAAAAYASGTLGECTDLFADLLHTLYLIYAGIGIAEKSLSLTELEAESWHCDGMFNFLPQKNFIPGPFRDSPLPLDIGRGPQVGIALLPDMSPFCTVTRLAFVEYMIPRGIFGEFLFSCGMTRTADKNETSAIFEILLDGKKVWESPVLSLPAIRCSTPLSIRVPPNICVFKFAMPATPLSAPNFSIPVSSRLFWCGNEG